MWDITSCYAGDGDLAAALKDAANEVELLGEEAISHIIARKEDDGSWWVDVIYRPDLVKN